MEPLYPGYRDRSLAGIKRLESLARGYDLLESGEVEQAKAFFRDAVRSQPAAEAFEALGLAAWILYDAPLVFEAREAAYELYLQQGDRASAARVATALTVDSAVWRGEMAVANGWLSRARTLLEGLPETPEHAYLALVEAQSALMAENDGEAAALHASRAVNVARSTGVPSLEAFALAIQGVAMVTTGRVREGMTRLDEAATQCLSGEVKERFVVSSVLCHMMDACDRARDWDRAREWFAHATSLAARWNDRQLYAQCRPHYAVVLTWRGDWADAEAELKLSIEDARRLSKTIAVEGIVRLAELRWRQGRWDEAESLFDEVRQEPLAQLGLAELCLGRGDPSGALDYVERCLRRLPKNDRLERMPALQLFIRACLAAGELERARESLTELNDIAANVPTRPVRAACLLCEGLLLAAGGRLAEARGKLEDSVDMFEAAGAPFETSRARLDLAETLLTLDQRTRAAAEAKVALAALQGLGARSEAERAALLFHRASAIAPAPASDTAGGLSPRETEVLKLLAAGLSNQEIADRLVLSVRTVQRHVDNIYAKTGARGRAAAGAFAASHGLL